MVSTWELDNEGCLGGSRTPLNGLDGRIFWRCYGWCMAMGQNLEVWGFGDCHHPTVVVFERLFGSLGTVFWSIANIVWWFYYPTLDISKISSRLQTGYSLGYQKEPVPKMELPRFTMCFVYLSCGFAFQIEDLVDFSSIEIVLVHHIYELVLLECSEFIQKQEFLKDRWPRHKTTGFALVKIPSPFFFFCNIFVPRKPSTTEAGCLVHSEGSMIGQQRNQGQNFGEAS